MLLPLFVAASMGIAPDTIPLPSLMLLGEPLQTSTYVRMESGASTTTRPPRGFTLSLPAAGFSALPAHLVDTPSDLGFTRPELDRAISSIESELVRGGFPGASLAIGRWERTAVELGFGTLYRGLGSPIVDPDHTLYDLASLTKVVATTTAVMLLVEDGKLDLDAPVSRYLSAFAGGGKEQVTVRHLLAHTSGLPAGTSSSAPTPEEVAWRVLSAPLVARPGQKVEYSDVGFIVLWMAAEAALGSSLPEFLDERVFDPLGMWNTTFLPGADCARCAPTEDRGGYTGVVHDPIARRLGGIAGHAGLFSTAHDLSRFAAMLANGGELEGVRILHPSTLRQFIQPQAGAGTRALGWDTPSPLGTGAAGLRISPSAFGHTGFTGTSIWVDPERGTWVVLLSNRTFRPSGPNRMQALRRELNDYVATAVDLAPRDR